jgi:hypothetical protein
MKSLRLQYNQQHLGTWPEASDDLPPPGQITVCPPPVPLNLPTFVLVPSVRGLPLTCTLQLATKQAICRLHGTGLPAANVGSSPSAHKASIVQHLNQMVMRAPPPLIINNTNGGRRDSKLQWWEYMRACTICSCKTSVRIQNSVTMQSSDILCQGYSNQPLLNRAKWTAQF